MKLAQPRISRTRAPAHRWRIPPPLRGSVGTDGPEGISILEEVGGPLGTLLWNTLRSVNAWIDTPPTDRDSLFPAGSETHRFADLLEAAPSQELESPMRELALLLERPGKMDPATVGVAATRIARWADHVGHVRTAAEFFQAAANSCMGNPQYALAAGRAARDRADYPRAEAWIQRSIGIARQRGDWSVYADAYLAYGTMMRRRGNMPAARKTVERALRRANRQHLLELQAKAYHDLFVIEFECERHEKAGQFARQAWHLYPPQHYNRLRLAHNIAYLWMAESAYGPALKVFKALEPYITTEIRPNLYGAMGLAAGGCGDRDAFEFATGRLRGIKSAANVAEAWLEIAQGAMLLADHQVALSSATQALEIARERKEHKIVFRAEETITSAHQRLQAVTSHRETGRTSEPSISSPQYGFAEEIIRDLQTA